MATEQSIGAGDPHRFQTDLEAQHLCRDRDGEPALLINPKASRHVVLAAAEARMQALSEGINAWLMTMETDADLHEVLRPFDHLAQEVCSLLAHLQRKEAAHG